MLIMFLFGLVLGGCQDLTMKEVEEAACTHCPSPNPLPPGDED